LITEPLFYALAIPAVTLLGLSKGGFAGVGMVSAPLLALVLPPLEAAAILLPILIVQDAISICGNRGKSRGGTIIRFTGGRESDSFWECRLPILTAFRTPT
jgi:uncharacterized protein